ncbi:hypothetical protein METBIDRAFT_44642 [Metschnikowia bicuspidata var. bicuspidata NRRL YB-4993]|uniref:Uncharacterized protein n=1 Tax=Metschnikowia bicuspidata var. bicuspidata NRRL YB-4993 TaxID=869754 RepID=A0A1A0H720_9ASCO|nr:hypothetical protein METBIDRAFT_44642 [Metschnikowia bicuspidata var. bicuspidata NRRL YB-4993]OBA19831.1 hypothetical protein METBIDRAFT_44642 [Metschnikowia bicuspidata var. bicuspidata NRRL YB-4993]
MGNKASKPARKLTGSLSNAGKINNPSSLRIQLPSQELKDRFENSGAELAQANEKMAKSNHHTSNDPDSNVERGTQGSATVANGPEGKDGMDPQADQNYINFINNLGRQIHSHSEGNKGEKVNVRALKQLLNRKNLHKKGQDEVQAQLESTSTTRSMVHPRTLTAIIYALHDPRVSHDNVMKDYQLSPEFLNNMDRFKVAENMVVIEDDIKEDEIGPKFGQPVSRAASDPSLMNENGAVGESVNSDRMKKLRSRLE